LNPTYRPETFDVGTEADAKVIILTPEGSTTDERWERETPYIADDICSFIDLNKESTLSILTAESGVFQRS